MICIMYSIDYMQYVQDNCSFCSTSVAQAFMPKSYVLVVFWTLKYISDLPSTIFFLHYSLHLDAIMLRTLRGFVENNF